MNDTCQTTVHSGDSFFSDMEDSGCQSADVPLARHTGAGRFIVSRPRMFGGDSFSFPVILPDLRALFVPEPMSFGACRCGMVTLPA